MPAITPLDASPGRTDPTFKAWVESLLESKLSTAVDEINDAIDAFNTNDLQGTSVTSFTPNSSGLGSQVFVTQSGKSWMPGQWVTIGYTSDGREYAAGPVQSYSGTSLTVDVQVVSGHGVARTSWQIAFSPPVTDLIGDHEVVVQRPLGYGSTNTKIRRYQMIFKNTGSNITYADSATLGASFTINADGDYLIERIEDYASAVGHFGVSVDPASISTNIQSLPFSELLLLGEVTASSGINALSTIASLSAGNIIYPHDGAALDSTSISYYMKVKRIK